MGVDLIHAWRRSIMLGPTALPKQSVVSRPDLMTYFASCISRLGILYDLLQIGSEVIRVTGKMSLTTDHNT